MSKTKKILIDIRSLETPSKNRGLGNYTQNLLSSFLDQPQLPAKFYYGITPSSSLSKITKKDEQNFFLHIPTLFWPKRIVRGFDPLLARFWERSIKKLNPDLIHLLSFFEIYFLSIPQNTKTIITIHDLIPLIFQDKIFINEKHQQWYLSRIKEAKKADIFIAISNSTKNDLVKKLQIDPNKIKVIYEGVDQKFKPSKTNYLSNQTLKEHHIQKPYILSVGSHSFYKNIPRVFTSFKNYLKRSKNNNLTLVIVCKLIQPELEDWQNQIKKLGLENKVILTNFVKDYDLPLLYSQSELLLFPSLYEGFGLPILEAMASGIPVITSNISSMPEVGGKAAKYVNPYSITEITQAIADVLENPQLNKYMIKEGFKNVKKFSWNNTAQQTIELYQKILEDKKDKTLKNKNFN